MSNLEEIPVHHVECPQQGLSADCGIFMLQFAEEFLKSNIDFRYFQKNNFVLTFDKNKTMLKRYEISETIKLMMDPRIIKTLPKIIVDVPKNPIKLIHFDPNANS